LIHTTGGLRLGKPAFLTVFSARIQLANKSPKFCFSFQLNRLQKPMPWTTNSQAASTNGA
jgi:hypothetical protein